MNVDADVRLSPLSQRLRVEPEIGVGDRQVGAVGVDDGVAAGQGEHAAVRVGGNDIVTTGAPVLAAQRHVPERHRRRAGCNCASA